MYKQQICPRTVWLERREYPLQLAACKLTDKVLKSVNKKMHVKRIFSDLAKGLPSCVNFVNGIAFL
jgi:hypothetical protein